MRFTYDTNPQSPSDDQQDQPQSYQPYPLQPNLPQQQAYTQPQQSDMAAPQAYNPDTIPPKQSNMSQQPYVQPLPSSSQPMYAQAQPQYISTESPSQDQPSLVTESDRRKVKIFGIYLASMAGLAAMMIILSIVMRQTSNVGSFVFAFLFEALMAFGWFKRNKIIFFILRIVAFLAIICSPLVLIATIYSTYILLSISAKNPLIGAIVISTILLMMLQNIMMVLLWFWQRRPGVRAIFGIMPKNIG